MSARPGRSIAITIIVTVIIAALVDPVATGSEEATGPVEATDQVLVA